MEQAIHFWNKNPNIEQNVSGIYNHFTENVVFIYRINISNLYKQIFLQFYREN